MHWRPKITRQSPRLFENDVLELLSRTHPIVVVLFYVPIVIILCWISLELAGLSLLQTLTLIPVGIVVWTLTEYWLHRVIMHWIPEFEWGPRLHFWVHGIHHDWPNDPYRLVMPPAVSFVLFWIFLGLWYLLLRRYAWGFHAGFTFGYVMYDVTHYLLHHTKPAAAWSKKLQRHHLLHHFNPKYEDKNFSITVPAWDRLFRTDRPRNS